MKKYVVYILALLLVLSGCGTSQPDPAASETPAEVTEKQNTPVKLSEPETESAVPDISDDPSFSDPFVREDIDTQTDTVVYEGDKPCSFFADPEGNGMFFCFADSHIEA